MRERLGLLLLLAGTLLFGRVAAAFLVSGRAPRLDILAVHLAAIPAAQAAALALLDKLRRKKETTCASS